MKTIFAIPTTMSGTNDIMPPRWGLGLVGDVAGYKHVAPLAPFTASLVRKTGQFFLQMPGWYCQKNAPVFLTARRKAGCFLVEKTRLFFHQSW